MVHYEPQGQGASIDYVNTHVKNGIWNISGTSIFQNTLTHKIGIGLTNPLAKVHILDTLEQLRLGYNSTKYTSFTVDAIGDLIIAASGGDVKFPDSKIFVPDLVGIGGLSLTANGNMVIDVIGGALEIDTTTGMQLFSTTTGTWEVDTDSGKINLVTNSGDISVKSTTGDIAFNTDDLFIDTSTSRVGVNTVTPVTPFQVGTTVFPTPQAFVLVSIQNIGNCALGIVADRAQASMIIFGDQDSEDVGKIRYDHADNTLNFATNNVEKNTIDSDGKFGSGTTSPLAQINAFSITEQLRLSYDVANKASFTVNSTGDLTIAPTGG